MRNTFKEVSTLAEQGSLTLYSKDIKTYGGETLTPTQEKDLIAKIRNGDRHAYNTFVYANLPLVIHIARKYSQNDDSLLQDLIQEGNIGMMKAIEKFDPRQSRFSTYAKFWIKNGILEYFEDHGRTIRYTAHSSQKVGKVIKAKDALYYKTGKKPSNDDIAKECNLSLDDVEDALALENLQKTVSGNTPIGDDDETDLFELQVGSPDNDAIDEIFRENLADFIKKITESGTGKYRGVADEKFGLGKREGEEMTFIDIGALKNMGRSNAQFCFKKDMHFLKKNLKQQGIFSLVEHLDL